MKGLEGRRREARRRFAKALVALGIMACAACSFLLDHNASQCEVSSDCFHFGGHPSCVNNLCVDSGLEPSDCFYGTPSTTEQYLNDCTTALCQSFDDCTLLGLCDGGDPPLIPPPAPDAAPSTPVDAGAEASPPALPNCVDPNTGRAQVVYINGSSNFPPLLQQIAPLVIAGSNGVPGPTPVFVVTSSCAGVHSMYGLGPSDRVLSDPPVGAKYAQYFDANGNANTCLLGGSVTADIGESDVFSTTCDPTTATSSARVLEQIGPVQAMAFIVPGSSSQYTISAEAAREVFGTGGTTGTGTPWTDPSFFYVRSSQTGTTQMIGLAIGVPPTGFWGVLEDSASSLAGVLQTISTGTDADRSIGLLSVDYYDTYRTGGILRALAFKASEQECAYLPDSNSNAFDKQNVRDGHYPIWGPLHFFAQNPPSPQGEAFLLTLNESQGVLDAFIRASLVPQCAMGVARGSELGPFKPATSDKGCHCYFETMTDPTKAQPADCKACTTRADCPASAPACNYGFCEAK